MAGKRQTVDFHKFQTLQWNHDPTGKNPDYGHVTNSYAIRGDQKILVSSGHPWPPKARGGGDIGGPFQMVKNEYSEATTAPDYIFSHTSDPNKAVYHKVGPHLAYLASATAANFPTIAIPSDTEMNALGTTMISQCIPTNPNAGLATFVGELKNDGLPAIIGSDMFKGKVRKAKAAGSEYLNYEFGWKPLVRDLLKFADSVRNMDKILAQYERNSGRGIRRRTAIPVKNEVVSVTKLADSTPAPSALLPFYKSGFHRGSLNRTISKRDRAWFSGSFTYYLDVGSDARSKIRRFAQDANKLFGIRITPEVVWDLAPWSWAADWVGNMGDVFHNVSAFSHDGLVMRYGYVMREIRVTWTYDLNGVCFLSNEGPHSIRQDFSTVLKMRTKATPFGFGLNPDLDFSNRQWAIIGALGLTKSDRKLVS